MEGLVRLTMYIYTLPFYEPSDALIRLDLPTKLPIALRKGVFISVIVNVWGDLH